MMIDLKCKLIKECEHSMKKFINETDKEHIHRICDRIVFIQLLFYQLYELDIDFFINQDLLDKFYSKSKEYKGI